MPQLFSRARFVACLAVSLAFLLALAARPALAQGGGGTGTLTVTVLDPEGKVVPGASLELLDLSTNSIQKATTTGVGTYSFVALPFGSYQLTTSKAGFQTQVNKQVVIQTGQVTAVNVPMAVGTTAQTVTVTAASTPLLQTTATTVATTVAMKQLQDLPLSGRNVANMAFLVAGSTNGNGQQTWNGLPLIAQTNMIDGVVSSTTRMKFAGNAAPGPQARLDSISEMTVTTGQENVGTGYGLGAMSSSYATTRGTNSYHGKVYEDFRNSWLNANSWTNNATNSIDGRTVLPRSRLILNDFGGSFGGPIPLILKHKLFFFGALGISKQPGGYNRSATVLSSLAQQGVLTEHNGTQVNVLTQVAQPNGLPYTVNSSIATELSKINSVLSAGALTPISGDPNVERLTWFVPNASTTYYPTIRVDYDITPNMGLNVAWNETKGSNPGAGAPPFPGSAFAQYGAANKNNYYTGALGFHWNITPTLINQFHGGYYYNATWYAYNATSQYTDPNFPIVNWAYGTSGQTYNLPITTYYPIVNFSDGLTWQRGSHMVTFGFGYWREQDHYWNPPDGILTYTLGLAGTDPATSIFNNYFGSASSTDRSRARNLYATLVGDVTGVGPNGSGFPLDLKTGKYTTPNVGEYPLDELMSSWNMYFNDSWRLKPTLTFTYGLGWDFENANHDLTAAYHSATLADAFGPTAPNQIFQPGQLNGIANPTITAREYAYQNYNVTPQPRLGFAWNPRHASGLLGKLTGDGKTVIRGGFNLRRFTEPQQYYWDAATNYGYAYYQYFSLSNVEPSGYNGLPGTFPAGQLHLGLTPSQLVAQYPFAYDPQSYQNTYTQASESWTGYWGGVANGFNYNIRQPYLEEWTLGIQRELGHNNVLEVRYLGHHALHEWVDLNVDEVNVFNNGFLSEFQAAQSNLAINAANGSPGNFGDLGFAGDQPLPIFAAAFANEGQPANQPYQAPDFSNGTFVNYLNQGAVGSAAWSLSQFNGPFYFCNMVGSSAFTPCATNIGYVTPGAGYPINFWDANPYPAYSGAGIMEDSGFGNYNGLQIELRQNDWHGMQFDANYTWSHTLGIEPNGNWTGQGTFFTLRNTRLSYAPASFDIRQVIHVSGTYSLPFGAGQRFANTSNPVLDRIVSGWTVGTIITYQTGFPSLIYGGYNTYNDSADGGIVLNGGSVGQLQSAMGVYHIPGQTVANGLNPALFQGTGNYVQGPTGSTIDPNMTAGVMGLHTYLYGPHFSNTDIAITKFTRIRENVGITFQGEFLNAFNHPNWAYPDTGVLSPTFGQVGINNNPRTIQLRASIDF